MVSTETVFIWVLPEFQLWGITEVDIFCASSMLHWNGMKRQEEGEQSNEDSPMELPMAIDSISYTFSFHFSHCYSGLNAPCAPVKQHTWPQVDIRRRPESLLSSSVQIPFDKIPDNDMFIELFPSTTPSRNKSSIPRTAYTGCSTSKTGWWIK